MKQMRALQTFSGPDGGHQLGEVFDAKDTRVEFLVTGGFAELVDQEPAPAEPKAKQ